MTDQLDFIDKLFDTLKETTDDNTKTLQKLVEQQISLIGTVETWPISEIKQDIKDHVISAANERKDISTKIDTKSGGLLEIVNDLTVKVKLMIGVVAAAVVLTGAIYVIGRFYIDYELPKQEVSQIQEQFNEQQKQEHNELIEAIREEIKKLHPETDKKEKER